MLVLHVVRITDLSKQNIGKFIWTLCKKFSDWTCTVYHAHWQAPDRDLNSTNQNNTGLPLAVNTRDQTRFTNNNHIHPYMITYDPSDHHHRVAYNLRLLPMTTCDHLQPLKITVNLLITLKISEDDPV